EGQVRNRGTLVIRGDPVGTGDDVGHDPGVAEIVDPDFVQEDSLGDPVRGGTDHARHGRAVAKTVRAVPSADVIYDVRPAPELGVGGKESRVNEVHVHAGARGGVRVGTGKRERALVNPV